LARRFSQHPSGEHDVSDATGPRVIGRVTSVDALRGLVMFTMIFVNDLAGVPRRIVPRWMRHYPADGNGMTFVDLVFPAFLFLVGMSLPFALGARRARGEPGGTILLHVITRALALLVIGVIMVNESPDSAAMGWSAPLWSVLIFLSAILACSSFAPPSRTAPGARSGRLGGVSTAVRVLGWAALVGLAFAYRVADGHRIITLAPFSVHSEWWGILGLIGWAYLVAAVAVLVFAGRRTALLGCMALLMCLYPADRNGAFADFWLSHHVGIGEALGSQAAVSVAGAVLATVLLTPDTTSVRARFTFTLLFIAGCAAAALLLHGLYGINKNRATPSWCLWACAITAALWLGWYFVCDVWTVRLLARPLAAAGANVLLAYLLSEMLPSAIELFHWGGWYRQLAEPNLAHAVARSAACAVLILALSCLLNRAGLRLKL
jgi:predicted acyltransferase